MGLRPFFMPLFTQPRRRGILGSSVVLAAFSTMGASFLVERAWREEAAIANIRALENDSLSEAPGSPGIARHLAFKGDDFLVVRSRADPGVVSGWHHHGDYDVYGYIVRGSARFENGPGGRDAITVGPGDFFHVPARTVHRDVNPSGREGQEVILFLRGSGPMVINVEGPDPA
jgi:quercetin dioxygenase-like cupin family protein